MRRRPLEVLLVREFLLRPKYDRIRIGLQQIPSLFQGSRVGGDLAHVGVVVRDACRQVNTPARERAEEAKERAVVIGRVVRMYWFSPTATSGSRYPVSFIGWPPT
jgi:hypothetical protein